jgi:hypothetical protein
VGNKRHHDGRVIPCLVLALVGALVASSGMAANPQRVSVQVSFVESIEIAASPLESGSADPNLAITSSPGRLYSILAEPPLDNPDDRVLTVSYQ